jgi:hypothetical protein
MPGNIPRSDLQTPLGRTWNAESRRDLDARLPGNPESRYHPRQFGVHPGNPGSIELVDREGDIVDVLAAVDFLLAQATYQAARQRWPKERIRLSQEARILEDSTRRRRSMSREARREIIKIEIGCV